MKVGRAAGTAYPTIVFHGQSYSIVHPRNGSGAVRAMGRSNHLQQTTNTARPLGAVPMSASPIPIKRDGRCVNTGGSAAGGTHGRVAAESALTPIRMVPTHQEKWCGFSSSTGRADGSCWLGMDAANGYPLGEDLKGETPCPPIRMSKSRS